MRVRIFSHPPTELFPFLGSRIVPQLGIVIVSTWMLLHLIMILMLMQKWWTRSGRAQLICGGGLRTHLVFVLLAALPGAAHRRRRWHQDGTKILQILTVFGLVVLLLGPTRSTDQFGPFASAAGGVVFGFWTGSWAASVGRNVVQLFVDCGQ